MITACEKGTKRGMTCKMPLVVRGKPRRVGVRTCACYRRRGNHAKPTGIIDKSSKLNFVVVGALLLISGETNVMVIVSHCKQKGL